MQAKFTYSLAVFLASGLVIDAARGAEGTDDLVALALPAAVAQDVEPLDLRRWAAATFHKDYSALITQLGETHGAEKEDMLLDAAELYLSHMLVYEAGSVLAGVAPVTPAQTHRHRALTDATVLLGGDAVEAFSTSPLDHPSRADRAFWQMLQAVSSADAQLLADSFEQSFTGLGLQSRAVLRANLPVFTEVAIEVGQLSYADAALRTMQELPGLSSSTTGQFLVGRAEEARGNEASALEAYFVASQGWDHYAVRARLAVADMALRRGSPGALLAAETTLSDGQESWRGGQFELQMLRRLVRIYQALGDDQEQLLTLGQVLTRFPNDLNVVMIIQEVETLLTRIYGAGSDGDRPLADWIDLHMRLLPHFRTLPSFPAHTETIADYLVSLGATDLAAREYRRAIRLLQELDTLNPNQTSGSIARLNIKLAKTQLLAGLAEDALITLELINPMTPTHQADVARLTVSALADLGAWKDLVDVSVQTNTPRHMRDLSKALGEEGKWVQSREVLLQFWHEFPEEFSVTDAASLLIASNRSDDVETRDKVIRRFPSLSENGPLVQLAKGMNKEMPDLTPLRLESASARLKRLQEAFDKISASQLAGSTEDKAGE